jgi:hypothetical protein
MSDAAAPSPARHLEMLEGLTECAYELGRAAAEFAKRTKDGDWKRFAAASAEFRHLAFAVRMGVRMIARLRAGQPLSRTPAAPLARAERLDAVERPQVERPDWREPVERERERSEPVSLPQFLKTLGLAAAAAEARKAELPPSVRDGALPRLHDLLAQAKADFAAPEPFPRSSFPGSSREPMRTGPTPQAATLVLDRPTLPRPAAGKARLLGSASTPQPPLRGDSS